MASIDTVAAARVDDTTITALRERLAGDLHLPGEEGYAIATPWNVAIERHPRAVIAAASAADVVATVRFAAAHRMRVAVQRTGHGAVALEGDDVLLVHTGALDECTVDAGERAARVGAGVVWQDVIDAATPHGFAPLVGSAPGVGVVGFLTGGGIGPLVRTYGLSSDHVRAFELVTGKGELLRVTPTDHAELFWGLRGGKGSLGIVTAVEIDLMPLASFYGGALYFDGADAPAVLEAWREMCAGLPGHSTTSLAILQLPPLPDVPPPLAGKMTVAVRFASVAQAYEAEPFLAPLRAVATPLLDSVAATPYAAIGSVHADPTEPMPGHEASGLLRELTPETVAALLEVAGPGSGSPQAIVELRQLGGELAHEPRHRSAFCHRGAAFSVLAIGVLAPEIAAVVPAHGAAVIAAMEPWATGGRLPNFAPSADPAEIALAYDEDTRAWLGALADQHDPDGVLNVGQVVRAASARRPRPVPTSDPKGTTMSRPSKSTVTAVIAGIFVAAFALWLEAGPAAAAPKPQLAHFKVEIKGVQQMYSQHTHEAEGRCDVNDYSSGSEKLVFKTKPIVIEAFHTRGLYNPEFIAQSAPDGLPGTATVTRNYTTRISGGDEPGCAENGGGGEETGPDCGTKTVSPFHLDLEYSDETKNSLFLLGGLDEDPFHNCPGVGGLTFPELISETTGGRPIFAGVSQDELFDPQYGKWIALASGTKKITEKDWWAKSTIHWDVSFTRLGKK